MNLQNTIDMLKLLEEAVPLRPPLLSWSDKQIWFYAGQRSMIDLIKDKLAEAEESFPEILSNQSR